MRKKLLSTVALLMALAMALAGCAQQQPAAQAPAAEAPVAEAPAAEAPDAEAPAAEATAEYPEMNIIIGHASPIDDARHIGALAIEEYMETHSGGKITVDVYPNGQLGDNTALIESTQNGAVHISIFPPANVASFNPLLGVLDVPYFLPGDLAKSREIMDGPAGDALLETMRTANMVGLDWWDSQFKQFSSNVPLRSTADFKGLKFRVMPSEVLLKMIDSLGGGAVTFDYSEVFSGLQTGAIDGQEASLASIYNMKFYEVQDYITITNHIKSEIMVFACMSWYDGLDDATKQLLAEACQAGYEANNAAKAEDEAEARQLIEDGGCEFVELTAEEIQGLSDAARQPCLDLYLASNGAEGQAIVDIFNEEIAKLS